MHRPGGPGGGTATTEDEVRLAGDDRQGDSRQLTWIQRRVAVAEADHVGCGRGQARVAGSPKAAARLGHHRRTEAPGDIRGPVGGAVVHDDRTVAGRDPLEHPGQGGCLVETGKDHIDGHRLTVGR
jgi:hypothetical protein